MGISISSMVIRAMKHRISNRQAMVVIIATFRPNPGNTHEATIVPKCLVGRSSALRNIPTAPVSSSRMV